VSEVQRKGTLFPIKQFRSKRTHNERVFWESVTSMPGFIQSDSFLFNGHAKLEERNQQKQRQVGMRKMNVPH
jgi:hypothetical protein